MDLATRQKPLRGFIRDIGNRLALRVERSNDSELGLDILLGRSRRIARLWDGGHHAQQYARDQGVGTVNRESKPGNSNLRACANPGCLERSLC